MRMAACSNGVTCTAMQLATRSMLMCMMLICMHVCLSMLLNYASEIWRNGVDQVKHANTFIEAGTHAELSIISSAFDKVDAKYVV